MADETEIRIKTNIQNFLRRKRSSGTVNYENFKFCPQTDDLNNFDAGEFSDENTFARRLTDSVLTKAVDHVNSVFNRKSINKEYYYESNDNSYPWPTIEEFNTDPEKIVELISNYVATWELNKLVKFFVRLKETERTSVTTYYRLEALFSCPTNDCPNPQAVCYVNFTIEVCAVIPKTAKIHVIYRFDGFNQIFMADKRCKFQNHYIKMTLLSKAEFYRKLKF